MDGDPQARRLRKRTHTDARGFWTTKNPLKRAQLRRGANVATVLLQPDSDAETIASVERQLKDKGMTVLQKSSTKAADTLLVGNASLDLVNDIPQVQVAVPKPRFVKMGVAGDLFGVQNAYFPSVEEQCSKQQTYLGGAKVDEVQGHPDALQNIGQGTLVVVWDFVPATGSVLETEEFTDRPGGPVALYKNNSDAIDMHGAQVASVCAGKFAGLARGAQVVLLGLGNDLFADLDVIDKLCADFGGPVIVNMSFGLEFASIENDTERQRVLKYIEEISKEMQDLKDTHKQLMFFIAAGNESFNMCGHTTEQSFPRGDGSICSRCMVWPQFELGKFDRPFITVGATRVTPAEPRRRVAPYSNYGACIDIFTHGGTMCGWNVDKGAFTGTQGTSFASPVAASLAALIFTNGGNKQTSTEVEQFLLGASTVDAVTNLPSGDTTTKFAYVYPSLYTAPTDIIDVTPKPLPKEPSSEALPSAEKEETLSIGLVVGGVVIVAVVAALFISARRTSRV